MMSKKFSNSLFLLWQPLHGQERNINLPELLALKDGRKGFRCKHKQRRKLYNNVKKTSTMD